MAERLPVGGTRNVKSPTSTTSSISPPTASSDICNTAVDQSNGYVAYQDAESTMSNVSTTLNGSATPSLHLGYAKQGNSEALNRNGVKTKEGESRTEREWVEQDEPGVYITFTSLPGGAKDLKRVRFRYIVETNLTFLPLLTICLTTIVVVLS